MRLCAELKLKPGSSPQGDGKGRRKSGKRFRRPTWRIPVEIKKEKRKNSKEHVFRSTWKYMMKQKINEEK